MVATDTFSDVRGALASLASALALSVESPVAEAEILVGHVLAATRSELLMDPVRQLSDGARVLLGSMIERRISGEPLHYVTGSRRFRSLDLAVGPGVLVPRFETEFVVERALDLIRGVREPKVLDVGTGSGAIALSIASERPESRVWATEISEAALEWATNNISRACCGNVILQEGDLFAPVPGGLAGSFDLVVSNPPYVSEPEIGASPPDVRDHEPLIATVAGPTGLEVTARLVSEAARWMRPGGWLVLEIAPQRAREVLRLLSAYEEATVEPDLAGRLRVARGRCP